MSGIIIYNQPHIMSKILYEFAGLCSKTALCFKQDVKVDRTKMNVNITLDPDDPTGEEPIPVVTYHLRLIFNNKIFVSLELQEDYKKWFWEWVDGDFKSSEDYCFEEIEPYGNDMVGMWSYLTTNGRNKYFKYLKEKEEEDNPLLWNDDHNPFLEWTDDGDSDWSDNNDSDWYSNDSDSDSDWSSYGSD